MVMGFFKGINKKKSEYNGLIVEDIDDSLEGTDKQENNFELGDTSDEVGEIYKVNNDGFANPNEIFNNSPRINNDNLGQIEEYDDVSINGFEDDLKEDSQTQNEFQTETKPKQNLEAVVEDDVKKEVDKISNKKSSNEEENSSLSSSFGKSVKTYKSGSLINSKDGYEVMLNYSQNPNIFFSDEPKIKSSVHVKNLEAAGLSLFALPGKTSSEKKKLCEVNLNNYFFDDGTITSKTKRDEIDKTLKNMIDFSEGYESYENNQIVQEGYKSGNASIPKSTSDLLNIQSDFSFRKEYAKKTSSFLSLGLPIKDFLVVIPNNVPTNGLPRNLGKVNGHAPDQRDYEGKSLEYFSLANSPAKDLDNLVLKIGQKRMEIKRNICHQFLDRYNTIDYMFHTSLKAASLIEKQVHERDYVLFTREQDIESAKDYITFLETSDDEKDKRRLQTLHPYTKFIIENHSSLFSLEEAKKIDEMMNAKIKKTKNDDGYWYSACYNSLSDEDNNLNAQVHKEICNELHLFYENAFVSFIDSAVRKFSAHINSKEMWEILCNFETSEEFINLVNQLPEGHPEKIDWLETRDGNNLFEVYSTFAVFDVASFAYNFDRNLITPLSEKKTYDLSTQAFCEMIASKVPEAVHLYNDGNNQGFSVEDDSSSNSSKYEEYEQYLLKIQDPAKRIIVSNFLNPFSIGRLRYASAKYSGRDSETAGGFVDYKLKPDCVEEEVKKLHDYYPLFNGAGMDISYDGQKISDLLKKD